LDANLAGTLIARRRRDERVTVGDQADRPVLVVDDRDDAAVTIPHLSGERAQGFFRAAGYDVVCHHIANFHGGLRLNMQGHSSDQVQGAGHGHRRRSGSFRQPTATTPG
jgi:hypothetical protein